MSELFLRLFLAVCGTVLSVLIFVSIMIGQANASSLQIDVVDYNDNNQFSIDSGNILAVYHTTAQTQFDKSLPSTSIGYSPLRDVNGGINIDSSSDSQQSIPDTDHNHKNDGKKNNNNGIGIGNGDTPFTLPFP